MSMNKLLYSTILGVCLLTACKKNKSNSVEDDLINKAKADDAACTCDPTIKKYRWDDKIIYVKSSSICYMMPVYYDSNGEPLTFDNGDLDEFNKQSIFIKEVWSCK
jgi:hypothetical protein